MNLKNVRCYVTSKKFLTYKKKKFKIAHCALMVPTSVYYLYCMWDESGYACVRSKRPINYYNFASVLWKTKFTPFTRVHRTPVSYILLIQDALYHILAYFVFIFFVRSEE